MDIVATPVDVREVVPHAGRMVLLRNVISHDAQATVCEVEITADSMFLEEGRIPSWVGLEYMAQAVAAHDGMIARARGQRSGMGFLLGSRKVELATQAFSVGQTLRVCARHLWGEGELFVFDCSVQDAGDGRPLVSAQLNLYRPRSIERFLEERGL